MTAMTKNDLIYTPCDGVIISLRKGDQVQAEEHGQDEYWLTINKNCRILVSKTNLETNYIVF